MYDLKDLRMALGLTQREAGELMVLSRSHVSMIELGLRRTPWQVRESINLIMNNLENKENEAAEMLTEVTAKEEEKEVKRLQRKLVNVKWQRELGIKQLTKMETVHVSAAKCLQFLVRQIRIFPSDTNYSATLREWYKTVHKSFSRSLPSAQEALKLRIHMLDSAITQITEKLTGVYRVEPLFANTPLTPFP